MKRALLGGLPALLALTTLSVAEDCEAPCTGTTVSLGLVEDWVFAATPNHLKNNSLQPEVGIESFFQPVDNVKFVSALALEQVVDPEDGKSSVFENLGVYQSELYAELALEPLTLTVGKISPLFSLASDQGDGISASDLAGNVDADDSLGAAAVLDFELADMAHALTGTVYTLDRSFLARSYLTKREVPHLSDGGAGNTSGLSSASLVLDGCFGADVGDCHDDGEFGYRLGARYQKHGSQTADQIDANIKPKDEWAFIAAVQSNFDVGEDKLRLMGEADYVKNIGSDLIDAWILTGIASYITGDFTFSGSYALQTNVAAGPNTSAQLAELAVVYAPESDLGLPNSSWSVGAAYAYGVDEDDQKAHVLSLRLNLEFGATHALR